MMYKSCWVIRNLHVSLKMQGNVSLSHAVASVTLGVLGSLVASQVLG